MADFIFAIGFLICGIAGLISLFAGAVGPGIGLILCSAVCFWLADLGEGVI